MRSRQGTSRLNFVLQAPGFWFKGLGFRVRFKELKSLNRKPYRGPDFGVHASGAQ